MNLRLGEIIAVVMLFCGLGVAAEMPSVQQLAEIRSQRSGAEMRTKAMPIMAKIREFSLSSPAWLYEPNWDTACVIVRGAGVGGEMGEVKAIVDGTVLKLR